MTRESYKNNSIISSEIKTEILNKKLERYFIRIAYERLIQDTMEKHTAFPFSVC